MRDGEFEGYVFADGTAVRFQRRFEQLEDGMPCQHHQQTLCYGRLRLLVNEVWDDDGVRVSPEAIGWGVAESRLEAEVIPNGGYNCPSCLGLKMPTGQVTDSG